MAIYDEYNIRYQLYNRPSGFQKSGINWLFLPGGPGADSRYMRGLAEGLDIPGNIWLIDLPGNGDHSADNNYHFDVWFKIFPKIVSRFENTIIVGHSFGGMFPLLFPELEGVLKGLVCIGSTPTLWLEGAVNYAKQFQLPDLSKEMAEFTSSPNNDTFRKALDACMPYYFPFFSIEKGRAALANVPFNYEPAVWWQRKAHEINFSAKWIPQNTPMMIINGYFDCICPYTMFQNDKRFQRDNIEMHLLKECGHMPWIEKPEKMNDLFKAFTYRVLNAACFAIAT